MRLLCAAFRARFGPVGGAKHRLENGCSFNKRMVMAKKRVVVLYGGRADEHSISCISTAGVLGAMDTERFEPIPVGITKDGKWIINGEDPRGWNLDGGELPTVKITPESRPVMLDPSRGQDGFFIGEPSHINSADSGFGTSFVSMSDPEMHHVLTSLGHVDAVLPVLHGPYGEDGTVQGLLEMMGVPYVGCGVFASAACMDKHYTKVVLDAAGIPTAPGVTVDARNFTAADVLAEIEDAGLTYPLFVKPSRAGSSFGVTKVEKADDRETQQDRLAAAIATAGEHDWKVLVEQGIDGREIECAVLCPKAGDEPEASWPGEIVLDHQNDDQFYDFDSKYMDASASHVEVPANLPVSVLEDVRDVARRAFKAVDGAGLSRVDTFVTPDGTVMVNEINTMPGFTPISMYPKAWDATGVSYTELITRLIEGVLR
ncbi:D-alanine--D-alanine ligase [Bifidobacterium longum]|uniref:D-alanine--D-alanine ligase n=9 Tax=Bifidobacterium TaxID=1678 RepID=DDL_BIFLO|nr:RecName: Full=D-alanine--D-alanine ligase; AltName: Full=D-Ala-D-Ala ligase; AltName: Full=D-alanylalanine synthetase [Bifidobacterium longum NCC2705]KAB6723978.1 D-alanine--D-alanine ligase [Bifidobacterium longum]MBD3899333.1 D-alanine--D-alanine ligase [Bifidobacterium longum subsp. longum]AAN24184.1 D-alanine--D-alanine ligase [Bifidobacterium longum NCC2705]KAB6724176.1 D-alanine--D-alanine ligase [Bifidobacterium longum]KAB6725237.1 D-alanine--D-alanine ligase [Bifidobacterium longum]